VDEFLRRRGLAYRSDLSNLDRSIPRNRIRHEVLPFLAEKGWSRAVEALASAAALAAEEDAYLDALAAEHGRSIVSTKGGSTLLDVARLTALPPALQRRVVWRALEESAGGGWAGAAHVTRVLALTRRPHGSVELPGRSAERRGGVLVLEPRPPGTRFAPDEAGTPAGASRNLPVPGTVETSDGWSVSARIGSRPPPGGSPQEAAIDAAAAEGGLYVRTRRPGDRFRPLGLGGRKKLQDFFVDRKVPRSERDRVPLVVDGGGRIVWVAGHAIAEEFRVTPQTRGVLLLELRRSGGKG
jgi:tRNA(Ile)-lysidine synthase